MMMKKTLNLVEYMIKNGSPRFVIDFREEIFRIRLLTQFTHKEDGEDKSASSILNIMFGVLIKLSSC